LNYLKRKVGSEMIRLASTDKTLRRLSRLGTWSAVAYPAEVGDFPYAVVGVEWFSLFLTARALTRAVNASGSEWNDSRSDTTFCGAW
jgi:hypothetical protein